MRKVAGSTLLISAALLSAEQPRTPVLVELFTSEGCSSCPPADLLLSHLQKAQPVAGAEVVVLSEHVDYWNQLGWTDPFSSASISERQRQYAEVLRGDGVYTPQMVVDGKTGFVGSDRQKAFRAIADAARAPKAAISLSCAANPLALGVRIDNVPGDADVELAIAESGLQSSVTRGENRGRTMAHTGVARHMTTIGHVSKQKTFETKSKLMIDKSWKRENLSAVVFVQDRASRRILGAGQIAISGCGTNY